ncbi:MAG: hypothetical protein EOR96_34260 [Mesorhizobium sp.]|nr:MAG: hypothetical protein EOR96_34260 [Mesorhizobium sp.]
MSDWITITAAVAIVETRTRLSNAREVLLDAIEEGHVDSKSPPLPDPLPIELFAGGITWVDIEFDTRIAAATQTMVDRDSLERWLAGFSVPPASKATPRIETGLPGRKEKGRAIIVREFERRRDAGETLGTLAGEVRAILNWFADAHPDADRPQPGSTENLLREAYRQTIKSGI